MFSGHGRSSLLKSTLASFVSHVSWPVELSSPLPKDATVNFPLWLVFPLSAMRIGKHRPYYLFDVGGYAIARSAHFYIRLV